VRAAGRVPANVPVEFVERGRGILCRQFAVYEKRGTGDGARVLVGKIKNDFQRLFIWDEDLIVVLVFGRRSAFYILGWRDKDRVGRLDIELKRLRGGGDAHHAQ
jgi:hypothetical protein